MRAARKPKPCVICDQLFTPLGAAHVICSAVCRSEDGRQRSVAWHVARGTMRAPDPERSPALCENCGKSFKRKNNAKTCSWACNQTRKAKAKRERMRETQGAELRALVVIKRCEAPIPAPEKPPGLACGSCAHWRPLAGSETGGMCAIERFRACNPYSVTPKFYRGAEAQ